MFSSVKAQTVEEALGEEEEDDADHVSPLTSHSFGNLWHYEISDEILCIFLGILEQLAMEYYTRTVYELEEDSVENFTLTMKDVLQGMTCMILKWLGFWAEHT